MKVWGCLLVDITPNQVFTTSSPSDWLHPQTFHWPKEATWPPPSSRRYVYPFHGEEAEYLMFLLQTLSLTSQVDVLKTLTGHCFRLTYAHMTACYCFRRILTSPSLWPSKLSMSSFIGSLIWNSQRKCSSQLHLSNSWRLHRRWQWRGSLTWPPAAKELSLVSQSPCRPPSATSDWCSRPA